MRDALLAHLQEIFLLMLRVVRVAAADTSLYTRILDAVKHEAAGAVMGLETVTDLARSLTQHKI